MFGKKQTVIEPQPKYKNFQDMFSKPLKHGLPYILDNDLVFPFLDGTEFVIESEYVCEQPNGYVGSVWMTPDYEYIYFVNNHKQERRIKIEDMIILSRLDV